MDSSIQTKFNEYQKKYPLYNKETILDKMIEDGAIDAEIARDIKSGTSLFLIDNRCTTTGQFESAGLTEIMGGHFKGEEKEVPQSKPNFNRKIENTFQSKKQGDCWLLSDINALNQTGWGREVIKNAIVPDEGQNGGVTINFSGSPLDKKEFYITKEEIQKAKASGNYSSGDDDMIALELAAEKVAKLLVGSGQAKRVEDFDDVIGHKSYLTNVLLDEKTNEYLNISKLLTGRDDVIAEFTSGLPSSENLLKYLADNKDKTSAVCTFDHLKDAFGSRDKDDPVHGNHAYAIKNIDYGRSVTVIDPFNTDKEINLGWDKFINDVETVFAAGQDDKTTDEMKHSLPENYFELRQKSITDRLETIKANKLKHEELNNRIKQNEINQEVNEILERLKFLENDIELNEKRKFTPNLYMNFDKYLTALNKLDKDNILPFLGKKPDIILQLDKYKSGIFNRKDKKELITPIINALSEKAKDDNIDTKEVEKFKSNCEKELNAVFYTDEQVIQNEVEKLVRKLNL